MTIAHRTLVGRVATADSGSDFSTEIWERLYEVALYAHTHDAIPTKEEIKTCLVTLGCSLDKATVLSDWFFNLCAILKSDNQNGGR